MKSEGADDVLKCASEIRKAEKTLCRSWLFASRWSLLSQLACLAGGNFLFFAFRVFVLSRSRVAGSLQSFGPIANEKIFVTLSAALDRRGLATEPAHSAKQTFCAHLDLAGHGAKCPRSLATRCF